MSEKAVKLFEALSEVDEELLERCNQSAGSQAKGRQDRTGTASRRFFLRYARAAAACVCLIMAGAAAWGGYRLVTGPCGSSMNGSQEGLSDMGYSSVADAGEYAFDTASTRTDTAANDMAASMAPEEADGQNLQGLISPEGNRDQLSDVRADGVPAAGSGTEFSGGNGTDGNQNAESGATQESAKEGELQDDGRTVPWAEACVLEPYSDYLPAVLPTGYEPFSAMRSGNGSRDNMDFKWSNGERVFSLVMTPGEAATKEEIEKRDGVHEYLAAEFEKGLIPEPLDGRIAFTLYYADGMRITFDGYITADEMWEVAESILK